MIRAVTFDFHNTIARCDAWFDLEVHDLVPAFFDWLERVHGVAHDPDLIEDGQRYYRTLRRTVMDTGIEVDSATSMMDVLDYLDLESSGVCISDAMADIFKPTLTTCEPMPGVIDTIRNLHAAGTKLAVVSSAAYHPFLEWTLRKFDIQGCFHDVLTSASTGYYKSTPCIYRLALDSLGVAPEACVHIGDSERFDVIPAASLGIRTVLYIPEGGNEKAAGHADFQITSLVGLPAMLYSAFGVNHEN